MRLAFSSLTLYTGQSTLENLVRSLCTPSRLKGPDKSKAEVGEQDVERNVQELLQVQYERCLDDKQF